MCWWGGGFLLRSLQLLFFPCGRGYWSCACSHIAYNEKGRGEWGLEEGREGRQERRHTVPLFHKRPQHWLQRWAQGGSERSGAGGYLCSGSGSSTRRATRREGEGGGVSAAWRLRGRQRGGPLRGLGPAFVSGDGLIGDGPGLIGRRGAWMVGGMRTGGSGVCGSRAGRWHCGPRGDSERARGIQGPPARPPETWIGVPA